MVDDRDKRAEKIVDWVQEKDAQALANPCQPSSVAGKLTPTAKKYAINRLAEGFSSGIIVADLKRLYGIAVSPQAIRDMRTRKHVKKQIEAIRSNLVEHLVSIPIAQKANRLAYLHHLYLLATAGRPEVIYDRDGIKHEVTVIDPGTALRAIKLAQEEIGEKEKWLADAIEKAAMAKRPDVNVVIVDYGTLPANESDRLVREWGYVFGKG
jgi:hypothetical protein